MYLRRVGIRLACRVAMGLSAWILLAAQAGMAVPAAQPLQQTQPAGTLHKQALKDYNDAARCGPVALRDALSAHHVMPDVRGCVFQEVHGYFPEFGGHDVARQDEASSLAAGLITHSTPIPDTALVTGQSVALYVSSGPPPVTTMPSVVGHTEADARGTLNQIGLRNVISQPGPSERPKDVVYEQTPESGSTVSTGTPVFLGISQGQSISATAVPDVVGSPVGSGEAAIRTWQLQPVSSGREYSNEPRGSISRTDPPAYTRVPEKSQVQYWVSLGQGPRPWPPPATSVPSVIGTTPAEAVAILRKAGLTAGEPIAEFSLAGTGRISRQEPSAGSPPPPDRMVLLWWPYAWLSVTGLVVIPLLILGFAAGLLLRHVRAKRRLAYTRAVLHIRPSLTHDGGTQLVGATPSIGRTLALRASLHPGEVRFTDPVSIERQEIQHD